MDLKIENKEKYSIAALGEEKLNSIIAPQLKSELLVLNSQGVKNIILNLKDVKFVDSSGLSAILIGNRLCKNADGTFVLCHINDNVGRLIQISQLQDVLNIVPTQEEAEDLVIMDEVGRDIGEEE